MKKVNKDKETEGHTEIEKNTKRKKNRQTEI
jgi:hypothetical protein